MAVLVLGAAFLAAQPALVRSATNIGAAQVPLARGADEPLPKESRSYRSARSALPARFVETQTQRFVVLSDANPAWTESQAALLEQTYHQFERYFRKLQIAPGSLRHKLVCVLFDRLEDYQQFARTNDGVTAAWISGYYSPRHDRVVFYDIEANSYTETLASWGQQSREALASHQARAVIATTVHEAVHQLIFHTGVQSARIQNPLWISEGLATSFETDRPAETFGPDRDYSVRVRELQRLLEADQLIPLRRLVQYTEMPDDRDETIAAVYHQSYALVTWMTRFRRLELARYIQELREEPSGRPSGARHLEIFESVFGDTDELETKWLRYERDRIDRGRGGFDGLLR